MSRHYSKLLAALMALLLMPLALRAQETFSYTYQGQTVNYQVLDEDAKTAMTAAYNNQITGDLVLPEHPMNGDVEYTLVALGNFSFAFCDGMKSVTIPSSVTEICFEAFRSCSGLESLTIPASVTAISTGFAQGCTSLTSIEVEAGNPAYKSVDGVLYTLDDTGLFQYPAGKPATSFTIPSTVTLIAACSFFGSNNLKSVEIPSSVEFIDLMAFADCRSLESLTIPASVTGMGYGIAYLCPSLTTINVEEGNTLVKSIDGVLYTADGTRLVQYPAGKPDETFIIPSTVEFILSYSVYYCGNLASVVLPETIKYIGSNAFRDCRNLKELTFPGRAEIEFGYFSFGWCENLVSVNIPEGVTVLPIGLFEACIGLKSISLPSTLLGLNSMAMSYCNSLETVECHAVTPPDFYWDDENVISSGYAFEYTPVENVTLHVPEGCREAYEAAEGWNRFGTIVDDLEVPAGIDAPAVADPAAPRDIYNMQGILLKRNATQADVDALTPGLYIVGGSKLLRR